MWNNVVLWTSWQCSCLSHDRYITTSGAPPTLQPTDQDDWLQTRWLHRKIFRRHESPLLLDWLKSFTKWFIASPMHYVHIQNVSVENVLLCRQSTIPMFGPGMRLGVRNKRPQRETCLHWDNPYPRWNATSDVYLRQNFGLVFAFHRLYSFLDHVNQLLYGLVTIV